MFYQKVRSNFFSYGILTCLFLVIFFIKTNIILADSIIPGLLPELNSRVESSTVLNFTAEEIIDPSCQVDGLNWGSPCQGSIFASIPGWGNIGEGPFVLNIKYFDAGENLIRASTTYIKNSYTPPVITLNGANPLNLNIGEDFTDPGATATDFLDGVMAVLVSGEVNNRIVGDYILTYMATDTANNLASTTRLVKINPGPDLVPPVITLIGDNPLNLNVGDTFTDPGATANDYLEGEVPVLVSGAVNSNIAGSYILTYTASDTASNTASTTREIKVNEVIIAPVVRSGSSGGGGGRSAVSVVPSPVVPESIPSGEVLGASTFRFLNDLSLGSENNDVYELQLRLIADGYLTVSATGYFGPKTFSALKAYQLAKQLPTTGFFGPMTRNSMNAKIKEVSNSAQINNLLEQIKNLQKMLEFYKLSKT